MSELFDEKNAKVDSDKSPKVNPSSFYKAKSNIIIFLFHIGNSQSGKHTKNKSSYASQGDNNDMEEGAGILSETQKIPASMIKLSCKGGAPLLPLSSPQKVVELGGATHPAAAAAAAFKQEPLAYLIDPKILWVRARELPRPVKLQRYDGSFKDEVKGLPAFSDFLRSSARGRQAVSAQAAVAAAVEEEARGEHGGRREGAGRAVWWAQARVEARRTQGAGVFEEGGSEVRGSCEDASLEGGRTQDW